MTEPHERDIIFCRYFGNLSFRGLVVGSAFKLQRIMNNKATTGTHPGPSNRLLISATWTLWNETLRRNDTLPGFLPSLRRLLPIYSDVKFVVASIQFSIQFIAFAAGQTNIWLLSWKRRVTLMK